VRRRHRCPAVIGTLPWCEQYDRAVQQMSGFLKGMRIWPP
jgi:hypothetical protein